MGSALLGEELVEVEKLAGDHRPLGEFEGREGRIGRGIADGEEGGDFLAPIETHNDVVIDLGAPVDHHPILLSNYFAQTEAMALGKGADTVRAELRAENIMDEDAIDKLVPHKVFNGNRLL